MDIMEAPRVDRASSLPQHVVPQPRSSAEHYAVKLAPRAELHHLYETHDFGRYRAQVIEGRMVLSPGPRLWHADVSEWLSDYLKPVCKARDWNLYGGTVGLRLAGHGEDAYIPDCLIIKDHNLLDEETEDVPAEHALLVAEIISKSSKAYDRKVKWLNYAQAGVPFYLLIDRFARPLTVTLYSEPTSLGYSKADAVPREPDGGHIFLPAPFGLQLDTATMPGRKR